MYLKFTYDNSVAIHWLLWAVGVAYIHSKLNDCKTVTLKLRKCFSAILSLFVLKIQFWRLYFIMSNFIIKNIDNGQQVVKNAP